MDEIKTHYRIVRYVLISAALATFVIGLSLIFFSRPIVEWFSDGTNTNEHFAVYLGAALVGFAITNWLYSKSHELSTLLPAIYGNITSLLAAVVIDGYELLTNNAAKSVWLIFILHLVFAVAFLYCLLIILRAKTLARK